MRVSSLLRLYMTLFADVNILMTSWILAVIMKV
jgi:hypothetical protein